MSDTIEGRITPEKQSRLSATLIRHDSPEAALIDTAEAVIATDGLAALLARALLSAVHGMVASGLDEKIAALSLPMLRRQVETIVTAAARGLRDPVAG